jgi:molybdopterin-guanine dinucleotide biosynthesis protein A
MLSVSGETASAMPVHGFVLAGGLSSRMGSDKALLSFRGRPMIEIAVATLREVCGEVSISGDRDDLAVWAPVLHESRRHEGPAAGVEAALAASLNPWVLMLPVDVPGMEAGLLRRWMGVVFEQPNVLASYMVCAGEWHPALCLVHHDCLPLFRESLDAGDRKLTRIFGRLNERLLIVEATTLMPGAERCFLNVNTPEELEQAERVAY